MAQLDDGELGKDEIDLLGRLVLQHSLDLITLVDREGIIRFESPAIQWMSGHEPSELVGKSVFEFVHPDDVALAQEKLSLAFATPSLSPSAQLRWRHKDGSWIWVESRGHLLVEGPIDGVVINTRDISEHRAAEEALRESEERFRSVVAVLAEGVVVLDASGAIAAYNDSAAEILGLKADFTGRMPNDPGWQLLRADGSRLPAEERPATVALQTGQATRGMLLGLQRPDGTRRWIKLNTVPLFRNAALVPYAVVLSFADVTDVRCPDPPRDAAKTR